MTGSGRKRVVVPVSGGGSNLQALIDASKAPDCPFEIVAVISNRPGVRALERAAAADIPSTVIDYTLFASRAAFDAALSDAITAHQPDYIALAGFMRVLTEGFTAHWTGRLINIHPALLPAFKGLHTHRRALEAGVAVHGCTVHWVSPGVDEGAIIGQGAVPVLPGDTEHSLAERVLTMEHRLYPACLTALCHGGSDLPLALLSSSS